MYSECDSLILFFNDTATTEIYTYGHTLSLHDALPIYNVARLNDADDIFDGPFSDRQSGMGAFEQAGANGVCICVCVNPVDFGARRHDSARRPVGQSDDAGNDRALAFFEVRKSLVQGKRVAVRVDPGGPGSTKKKKT